MELQGKAAIVTGGGVRIGRTLVQALAAAGVKVCIHYGTSVDEAHELQRQLQSEGHHATTVQADLRHGRAAAQRIVDHAVEQFTRVDILVNSAAVFGQAGFRETEESEWDRHFDVNLKAPFLLCRQFAEALADDQPAHVVNILDWRALRPRSDHFAYTLTKAALAALTSSLALELAPRVQVNAIAPGAILPPVGKPINFMQSLTDRIPLRRTGTPDDVADALLFLLRSDFITGEIIRVTGGEEL